MIRAPGPFEKREAGKELPGWRPEECAGSVNSGGRKPKRREAVTLRCRLDGLMLPAMLRPTQPALVAYDGEESFAVEAVEALFYEVVTATAEELLGLEEARYRLLRRASDFQQVER
jgi:hypothetical protein